MKKKVWIIVITIILILILGYIVYLNIKNNGDEFYKTSIVNIVSIILTFAIAYYLTQLMNNERKKKEELSFVIEKIQSFVDSEEAKFKQDVDKQKILLKMRSISNCIYLLEKYSKSFGLKKEVAYIKRQYTMYKDYIDSNYYKPQTLPKNNNRILNYLQQISFKCDEMRFILCK